MIKLYSTENPNKAEIIKQMLEENDINVETENPEFSEWKWIKASKLIENAVPFKRIVYKTILDEFSDIF